MCFRSESLAVYSCMRARASARLGSMAGRGVEKRRADCGEEWGRAPYGMCPRRRPPVENTPAAAPALGSGARFLREVSRREAGDDTRFPFSVPVIRSLTGLPFDTPVTFFVGENGSGKST